MRAARSHRNASCLALAAILMAPSLHAESLTVRGKLSAQGAAAQGVHAFRVTPYPAREGGERLTDAVLLQQVELVDGRFALALDFGPMAAPAESAWLQLEVAGADGAFVALPGRLPVASAAAGGTCWDTAGNALTGTEFIGSTNAAGFQVRVANEPALTLMPALEDDVLSPNIVAGAATNFIANAAGSVVAGGGGYEGTVVGSNQIGDANLATIGGGFRNGIGFNLGGGDFATIAGGARNQVRSDHGSVGGGSENAAYGERSVIGGGYSNITTYNGLDGTVAGGADNEIDGPKAAVGGGELNVASGFSATIGGGYDNRAPGYASTVAGGYRNVAGGEISFAGGGSAHANHRGMFAWGDDYSPVFDPASTSLSPANGLDNGWTTPARTFNVRARGGVWFVTGLSGAGNRTGVGAYLFPGSSAWSQSSSRTLKTAFADVDVAAVLDRVLALPLSYWSYKTEAGGVRHLGPFAEDFAAAFGLGPDPLAITTIDADGVALAAIQGLNARLESELARRNERIEALEARLARLEAAQAGTGSP
jgi:hypothetical protein